MNKVIGVIESEPILQTFDVTNQEQVQWRAKGAIDDDGSANIWHDPDWQPNTSLHLNGKPIDADKVPYIVVPPLIIQQTKGIVLGCMGRIFNLVNGLYTPAVVADVGPHTKLGEMSDEAARRIKINPSPVSGGTVMHILRYTIWPGKQAIVDGVTYQLQPS